MATINQLSESDVVENGDQFPIFSEAQGDTRRVNFLTIKQAVAEDFVSSASLAGQTGAGLVGTSSGITVQQALDALPTSADLSVVENEAILRDGHKIENIGAMRAFLQRLAQFNLSEEGVIPVACYGDSVSMEVAMTFIDMLAREHVGFVGTSSWSDQRLNNAWETPTSVEGSGRWPGSGQPSYVLAGGATFIQRADGQTPDPIYNPARDRHWVIPSGGSVTWTIGLAGSNYRRCLAFLVKESGAGDATVELLNAATDAVISTTVVGSLANGSIDATHADFTSLDTALGYKIRVSCTSGTIRALGVMGMQRRCVLPLFFSWGGSYLQQQNRSSKAIFDYICNTINPAIWFVETRGETPVELAGAGIGGDAASGITNLCTRLNAVPGTKVFIGGKPTTNVVNDDAQTALYRAAARTNDYVFIDGVALLKNNAALAALGWNQKNGVTDNVHLNLIASAHIASILFDQLPLATLRNLWSCRDVFNTKVITTSYRVMYTGQGGEITNAVEFATSAAVGTYATAALKNISTLTLKQSGGSGGEAILSMFDANNVNINKGLNIPSGSGYKLNGTDLLRGQVSGWAVPTGTFERSTFATYTAPTISGTYTPAEVQALADHVQIVSRRLGALLRDLNSASATNVRLLS